MIDFHTHILPDIDDGACDADESLQMLKLCKKQGVDIVFATPHFYPNEDDPDNFIESRTRAFRQLTEAMDKDGSEFPVVYPAAEVLYFPGMSMADGLASLKMGELPCILIEPPMIPWGESMLDEIEETGNNLNMIPIIAHIDRYMRLLNDYSLTDMVSGRRMLVQVNASFFIREQSRKIAMEMLNNDEFHLIGSDCHNLTDRAPNIGTAAQIIRKNGGASKFAEIVKKSYRMIGSIK
ncbi:MAG: hypothetical protein Q4E35_04805 [Eubacteriales bacterium]|nr:hypothetical protein [Eubacteriales bacterium]